MNGLTRPLVHIGYHRTATTWFQERFYPAARNGKFIGRSIAREALIAPKAFEFSAEVARRQLSKASDSQRILICEENLSGYLHNGGLGGLLSMEVARRIKAVLPNAQIVIFLRSQPAIIAAAYAQYVKGGGTHSIERYVRGQQARKGAARHWYKAPLFMAEHYLYNNLIGYYAELFGRASVSVSLYEDFAANSADFLRNFSKELSIDVDLAGLDLSPLNASEPSFRLLLLRRLNLLTERSVLDKRTIADIGGWYGRRWTWLNRLSRMASNVNGALMPSELKLELEDYYRTSNGLLADEWNLPLRQFGYPMPSEVGSQLPSRPPAAHPVSPFSASD
jgi:hypothetical protein